MPGPSPREIKKRQGGLITWDDLSDQELRMEITRRETEIQRIEDLLEQRKRDAEYQRYASNS